MGKLVGISKIRRGRLTLLIKNVKNVPDKHIDCNPKKCDMKNKR
jgi:hypothetical protein